jgi:hypothetical protein
MDSLIELTTAMGAYAQALPDAFRETFHDIVVAFCPNGNTVDPTSTACPGGAGNTDITVPPHSIFMQQIGLRDVSSWLQNKAARTGNRYAMFNGLLLSKLLLSLFNLKVDKWALSMTCVVRCIL